MHSARLAWLRQMVTGNVWYESGATRTFVRIAEQMRDGGDAGYGAALAGANRTSLLVDANPDQDAPVSRRCRHEYGRSRLMTRACLRLSRWPIQNTPEHQCASVSLTFACTMIDDPIAVMDVGIAAEKAGDFAAGARFLARAVAELRQQVRLGPLTQALVHLAWAAIHTGEWGIAAAASAEGARLARDTRQPQYGLTGELIAALVSALRGTEQDIEAVVAQTERTLQSMKGGPLLATAHLARGAAALGDGRHEEAFRHLWPVFDDTQPAFHRFMRWSALLDLVEAAVGSGQADQLVDLIAELEDIAAASGSPFLQAELVAARPLLAADDEAEQLFVAAVGSGLKAHPFLEARTLFSFGRWLRRRRRPADARVPLRQSIEVFDTLGATQWSKRARQELRATGVTNWPANT